MTVKTIVSIALVVFIVAGLVFLQVRNKKKNDNKTYLGGNFGCRL